MSDPTPKLEELKGSTLDTVTLDWRNGIALATFLGAGASRSASVLRATDVTMLELPRTAAASKIVRSAKIEGNRATLVMETGEELHVVAATFSFDAMVS